MPETSQMGVGGQESSLPPTPYVGFWERIFKPNVPDVSERKNFLLRCGCGELYWCDSPQEIQMRHLGHTVKPATGGTLWEAIKLRMGWIK